MFEIRILIDDPRDNILSFSSKHEVDRSNWSANSTADNCHKNFIMNINIKI